MKIANCNNLIFNKCGLKYFPGVSYIYVLAVMPMGDTINKPNTYTMATTLNYVNNYAKFKEDFKKDTGLDASKNVAEYINYFNARMADMNYQMNFQLANQYLNEINLLPGNIALRTAESLKQLIKNLPK